MQEQVARRLKARERKERTRRLIQVVTIFEKYFDVEGEEEAEKLIRAVMSGEITEEEVREQVKKSIDSRH